MVSEEEEKKLIRRELKIRSRIDKLSKPALKVTLFSLRDLDELERIIKVGEDYMKAVHTKE